MLIAGRFEVLGSEVAGRAIKARDLQTAQTVVLIPAGGLDPRMVGIFHPSLVTIFAIVEHDGSTLAAAEFVQGRTLADIFGDEPCHPRRAAEVVGELADGVAELHALGLTHGAISRTTAILTAKGKAKLVLAAAQRATQDDDLQALKLLYLDLSRHQTPGIEAAGSVVTLAALLREHARNPRPEPSS